MRPYFKVLLTLPLVLGMASACGPMNTKPADPLVNANSHCMGATGDVAPAALGTGLSKNGNFVVQGRIKDPQGNWVQNPQKNDNLYLFRFVQTDSFIHCSKDAQLSVDYVRLDGQIHDVLHATVQKNDDDTFSATLTFKRAGNWEIDLHIVDGAVKDDHTMVVNVPKQ